ncbi:MAG TPA: hypothetical protein VHV51_21215 [Polyangiaceae bacterium]|jgi:hypothetical protein|nr:hypothetical protein [Polyangiaceae bacterium]
MDRVDFFRLARPVQERFVESTQGSATPAPLAILPLARDAKMIGFALLGGAAFVLAIFTLRIGYGDLASRYALVPLSFAGIYSALFALSALGFFKAAARHIHAYAVPYRPAQYLFPIGVIDARAPELAVHRVSEQTQITVDEARRVLRVGFDGNKFEFPARDLALAAGAAQQLSELRDRLANAGPDSSAREQALVDPLVDNGFKNPFAPAEAMRRVVPGWLKFWPFLALILGVLLGGLSFRVRNTLSEARLYRAARSADSAAAYRAYLARGGTNPDVAAVLLPRAELRDAIARSGVAAIEQFVAVHPQTKIQPEVDAALHAALLKELARAEALGTFTALKDFAAQYARYPFLDPDLDRAIDARIQATLQALKPALAPSQTRLLPFFERLLRFTAKHGPEVDVRFQRKPSETIETAEKVLRQSAYFTGEKNLPSAFFDAAHVAPRERAAADALASAINEHFPRDLVDAKAAPTLEDGADVKATVPTMLIVYHTEMSGAFTSRRPRFAISGVGVIGKASFEIPGDAEPLPFKLTVWRAPDLRAVTDTTTPADLYETMASEAFKKFSKKYLATIFVEH